MYRAGLITLLGLILAMALRSLPLATIGFVHDLTFSVPGLTDSITQVEFNDIDGDGFPEVLATDRLSVVLYSITGDSVIFTDSLLRQGFPTELLLEDVNRDSIADIVVAMYDPTHPLGSNGNDSAAVLIGYDGADSYAPTQPITYSNGFSINLSQVFQGPRVSSPRSIWIPTVSTNWCSLTSNNFTCSFSTSRRSAIPTSSIPSRILSSNSAPTSCRSSII
jgi:hypothetical protein